MKLYEVKDTIVSNVEEKVWGKKNSDPQAPGVLLEEHQAQKKIWLTHEKDM